MDSMFSYGIIFSHVNNNNTHLHLYLSYWEEYVEHIGGHSSLMTLQQWTLGLAQQHQ